MSIALNNHEHSYAEWFKYVDDCNGLDELALYCLPRKYGTHTAVYNKSYVWTTISNCLLLSDTKIFECCGVHLIFLGQTKYGVLREIKQPSPCRSMQPTTADHKPSSAQRGCCNTTCRSGTHNTGVKKEEKTINVRKRLEH